MNKEIGTKIRKLRELRHITQFELSQKAGIAQSTLSYIENGKKAPQFDTLCAICHGLGISVFELFSYDVLKSSKKFFEQHSKSANDQLSDWIPDELSLDMVKELYESEKRLSYKQSL